MPSSRILTLAGAPVIRENHSQRGAMGPASAQARAPASPATQTAAPRTFEHENRLGRAVAERVGQDLVVELVVRALKKRNGALQFTRQSADEAALSRPWRAVKEVAPTVREPVERVPAERGFGVKRARVVEQRVADGRVEDNRVDGARQVSALQVPAPVGRKHKKKSSHSGGDTRPIHQWHDARRAG